MGVRLIKLLDRCIGTVLVLLLSLFRLKPKSVSCSKVLVMQFWGVGETILTLPAIRALHTHYPKAGIDVLTTSRVYDVYAGLKFIDRVNLLSMSPFGILFYAIKNFNNYDLVIDFEEYLNISSLISFFVGRERLGYSNRLRRLLYTKSVAYNDRQHVVETHLDLVRLVGADAKPKALIKPAISPDDANFVNGLLSSSGIMANDFVVCIAPGAAESAKSRMWPLESYAGLAERIIKEYNAKVLFVGGPDEFVMIQRLKEMLSSNAFNLAGKTSLKQLFCLIGRCSLFIGNDSGPVHIAAAMGVKTIGLFGPNIPARWAPFGSANAAIYKGAVCKYSPCINVHLGIVPECHYGSDNVCMKAISVDDVFKTVEGMMKR